MAKSIYKNKLTEHTWWQVGLKVAAVVVVAVVAAVVVVVVAAEIGCNEIY